MEIMISHLSVSVTVNCFTKNKEEFFNFFEIYKKNEKRENLRKILSHGLMKQLLPFALSGFPQSLSYNGCTKLYHFLIVGKCLENVKAKTESEV